MKDMKPTKGIVPAGMYADGGMVKKKKAMMKEVADQKVKEHEAKMHGKKMADGGKVKGYADGGYVCGHKAGMSGKNMKK